MSIYNDTIYGLYAESLFGTKMFNQYFTEKSHAIMVADFLNIQPENEENNIKWDVYETNESTLEYKKHFVENRYIAKEEKELLKKVMGIDNYKIINAEIFFLNRLDDKYCEEMDRKNNDIDNPEDGM